MHSSKIHWCLSIARHHGKSEPNFDDQKTNLLDHIHQYLRKEPEFYSTCALFCLIINLNLIAIVERRKKKLTNELPVQLTPSPEYPIWHVQKNDPLVLEQLASAWQLCDRSRYSSGIKPGKHSSTSRIWERRVQQRNKLIEDFFSNKRDTYQHTLSHLQHNLFYRCNRMILSCLYSLHLSDSCGRGVHAPGINHEENTHLCLQVWKKRVIEFIAIIIIVCPPQFKEESRQEFSS